MKRFLFLVILFSLPFPARSKTDRSVPSPTPTRRRMRIGDVQEFEREPTKVQKFEATLTTFLGLSLFFWAPNTHVIVNSPNVKVVK